MAHQELGSRGSECTHAGDLHKALRWLTAGAALRGIAFRFDCTWTPRLLAFAALLWAWSDERTLGERFTIARKIIINRLGGQQEPAGSYQAFIKLLVKWTEPLREALSAAFRAKMAQALAVVWKVPNLAGVAGGLARKTVCRRPVAKVGAGNRGNAGRGRRCAYSSASGGKTSPGNE